MALALVISKTTVFREPFLGPTNDETEHCRITTALTEHLFTSNTDLIAKH